jgi:uncharacterized protein (DUF1697 family)
MATYIALLRGINVSGSNLIRMDALKESMRKLGLSDIITYIQSGNIVFSSPEADKKLLEELISKSIALDFNCEVPVKVLSSVDIEGVKRRNPFISQRHLPIEFLHVTFLSMIPDPMIMGNLLPVNDGNDEAIAIGNIIYLYCPNGYGRTKFNNTFFERKLKLTATTRNWKTMLKLTELARLK